MAAGEEDAVEEGAVGLFGAGGGVMGGEVELDLAEGDDGEVGGGAEAFDEGELVGGGEDEVEVGAGGEEVVDEGEVLILGDGVAIPGGGLLVGAAVVDAETRPWGRRLWACSRMRGGMRK